MKKSIHILLAFLACLALLSACGKKNNSDPAQASPPADTGTDAAASETQAPAAAVQLSDYYGCWEDGNGARVSMTIAPREERGDVEAVIYWGVGARELNEWIMHGTLDPGSGVLSYADGIVNRVTWGEGLTERTEPVRQNGKGTLALSQDGTIKWSDAGEPGSASFGFVRAETELPTAQELLNGYFKVVGGEAAPAWAACEALRFAYLIDAFSQDSPDMRAVLSFAWESMSEEEQNVFLTNFPAVVSLIDKAATNYEEVREAFDAVGAGGEMEALADSAYCRACWASLRNDTVNMDSDR